MPRILPRLAASPFLTWSPRRRRRSFTNGILYATSAHHTIALDVATGAPRWRYHSGKPMIGGLAATGGDVDFAGEISGDFLALDADNGNVLYRHNLGGPIAGGIVSYAVGGKQYVAAVSGFVGGYYNQMAPEIGGGNPTITVFGLKP